MRAPWSEDFSSSWTDRDTVAIAFGVAIENATGGDGNDTLIGNALGNRLTGGAGNDTLDGGAGLDTATYNAVRATYALAPTSGGFVISSSDGTDNLSGIERLQFSDKKIALDLAPSEHAGQALEFIGVMAPSLIHAPSIVGVVLGLIDGGLSMEGIFQLAIDIGLVNDIAGSNSTAAVAQMAFRNVIGVEAGAAMTDQLVSYMDGRIASFSQAGFLSAVAGMDVNQAHIGLIGLQQTGVEFI